MVGRRISSRRTGLSQFRFVQEVRTLLEWLKACEVCWLRATVSVVAFYAALDYEILLLLEEHLAKKVTFLAE